MLNLMWISPGYNREVSVFLQKLGLVRPDNVLVGEQGEESEIPLPSKPCPRWEKISMEQKASAFATVVACSHTGSLGNCLQSEQRQRPTHLLLLWPGLGLFWLPDPQPCDTIPPLPLEDLRTLLAHGTCVSALDVQGYCDHLFRPKLVLVIWGC